jgi:hypothetical protein
LSSEQDLDDERPGKCVIAVCIGSANRCSHEHPHDASLLVIETLFRWVSNARVVVDALARQARLVSR